jgi:hemolysin activation/secretion protein
MTKHRTSSAIILSFTALALAPLPVLGQVAPGDVDTVNAAIEEQRRAGAAAAPPPPAGTGGAGLDLPTPPAIGAAAGGPCFDITAVNVSGWEPTNIRPTEQQVLVGQCVTARDIGEALNEINLAYQEAGLTTTRGYLPEQDIDDGTLDIIVVPGRIEGFVYADGRPADRRLEAAFPTEAGDLLNLRALEQGFDNIGAPQSASGDLTLLPGTAPGDSIVAVAVEDTRPWHLSFDFSTEGQETTGEILGSVDFAYDNLLGLNETIRFTAGTTPTSDRPLQFSDNASLSLSLPIGNWSHYFAINGSAYSLPVAGINQGYTVEGQSRGFTWSSTYMLFRDQTRVFQAYGGLDLSESRSFIEGLEIESQRRNITVGNLGFRGEHTLASGQLNWDFGVRFGLDAFGAEILSASIVEKEFLLWQGSLDYSHRFGESAFSYTGRLAAQASDDILPGSEQFSIGGWSNVRGFHGDSMYGDSGVYLRNTLTWKAEPWSWGALSLSAGLDAGYVVPSTLRSWNQRYLVGASFGATLEIDALGTLSFDIAHALSRPDENLPNSTDAFEDDLTVARVGLEIEF